MFPNLSQLKFVSRPHVYDSSGHNVSFIKGLELQGK